ncbi:MAG: prolyl oligopeptidase family serine peptidase [Armatimonadota bacterium]|jgi:cephalosporin-C deacetylase-like acetyl esterase
MKTIGAVVLSVTVAVSCLAQQLPEPQNLAPNPSFEDGDARRPSGWSERPAQGSTAAFEWAEGVARTGERSVSITRIDDVDGADRWRAGTGREIGARGGTELTLTAWAKTEQVEGAGAHLQIYAIGIGGEILAQPTGGAVRGTTDWTEISVRLTVPDEPCYVMPYLGLRGTGTAWFDDVRMMGIPGPGLPPNMDRAVYEAAGFEELDGYQFATRGNWRLIEATPGREEPSLATVTFYEATAKWDVTMTYLDEPDGASTMRLLVNGEEVGHVVADETVSDNPSADVEREVTFEGVNIQRWMPITVVGEQDEGEYARVIRLTFVPVGQYEGDLLSEEELPPPNSLRVWLSPSERRRVEGLLGTQAARMEGAAYALVRDEIESLQTPEELRAYQARVRESLPEIFGRWTGDSGLPLNPRTFGTIELDYCTIEKVVIEAEPEVFVPLNVYVPKDRPLPAPGILVTIGHAGDGKAYHLYHEFALGLAEKGYVAVALDPIGQGERTYWDEPPEELGRKGNPVGQHHYQLRRSFLVGRSLSGLRTRDCVRVVDYMLTRDDVIDPDRVGVAGNSGGGQTAMQTIACHPAVKVCVAAHPGGSCENTYYRGKNNMDRMIVTMIAPRPLIWVVGEDSGERHHEGRFTWLDPLYDVFGAPEAHEFEWVEGVHDMRQPKREAAYAWLNRWLGMDSGREEGPIEHLEVEDLWITETGLVETGLGGVMPWHLDTQLMREMAPERPEAPADDDARARFLNERRAAVLEKLRLAPDEDRLPPIWEDAGQFEHPDLRVLKLILEPEAGITIAALLVEPVGGAGGPTIIHAAEHGKPVEFDAAALPLALALEGRRVVSVDVRGRGELNIEGGAVTRVTDYDRTQWRRDSYAMAYANNGRTMPGARAMDLISVMDHLDEQAGAAQQYALVGEGLGGVWALAATMADARVASVATVGMLSSYARVIESKWHAIRDYFWVPRALDTYDLPDLPALIAPRQVAVLNPMDEMLHALTEAEAAADLSWAASWFDAMDAGERLIVECGLEGTALARAVDAATR